MKLGISFSEKSALKLCAYQDGLEYKMFTACILHGFLVEMNLRDTKYMGKNFVQTYTTVTVRVHGTPLSQWAYCEISGDVGVGIRKEGVE